MLFKHVLKVIPFTFFCENKTINSRCNTKKLIIKNTYSMGKPINEKMTIIDE
tara:strand:- start:8 stop:163 length:156 start_codon:yes stop_codon:yes gene_type:complete